MKNSPLIINNIQKKLKKNATLRQQNGVVIRHIGRKERKGKFVNCFFNIYK
jgi:hypothetical protein